MAEDKLQKRSGQSLIEGGQYVIAIGVVGTMLLFAGFPVFVLFFFGMFTYFLFRIFTAGSRNGSRDIFEFYLSANEMLREDGRNWFGFEVRDAITRGEAILETMRAAPPLVHFALGALYNKAGDHQAAINTLTPLIEQQRSEAEVIFPTPELRNYVRILRKIERDPSEAPMTSAAIRALERARKLRGKAILEASREAFAAGETTKHSRTPELTETTEPGETGRWVELVTQQETTAQPQPSPRPTPPDKGTSRPVARGVRRPANVPKPDESSRYADRKPITEVLHDIYDKNVQ